MNPPPASGTGELVVVVEDDAAIAEGLALNLKLLGYRALVVSDAETARQCIEDERADLVLLDITLPKQSGLWVLQHLRDEHNHVPVIVLSARQDEYDKVAALRLGADDYITKPFALAELLARVDAVLRRARLRHLPAAAPAAPVASAVAAAVPVAPVAVAAPPPAAAALRFGEVVVDLDTRTVTRGGEPVELTHLELELLAFLCRNPSRVYSRDQLLREVWGFQQSGQARTVDNFIAQLRAKLEESSERPRHFLTVRGSGYRFVPG